jgi:hypothetical protein
MKSTVRIGFTAALLTGALALPASAAGIGLGGGGGAGGGLGVGGSGAMGRVGGTMGAMGNGGTMRAGSSVNANGSFNGAVRTPDTTPATGAVNRATRNAENRANTAVGNGEARTGAAMDAGTGAVNDTASIDGRAQVRTPGAGISAGANSAQAVDGVNSTADSATGRVNRATRHAQSRANAVVGNAGTALNDQRTNASLNGSVSGSAR